MNPNEINKRIAIACHLGSLIGTPDERHIPNYHGDLNAMHAAEKWMHKNKSLKTFWDYTEKLGKITPSHLGTDSVIHATAAQRAEAFLRTIGQWEDGK
jgi:hypothetical protein